MFAPIDFLYILSFALNYTMIPVFKVFQTSVPFFRNALDVKVSWKAICVIGRRPNMPYIPFLLFWQGCYLKTALHLEVNREDF